MRILSRFLSDLAWVRIGAEWVCPNPRCQSLEMRRLDRKQIHVVRAWIPPGQGKVPGPSAPMSHVFLAGYETPTARACSYCEWRTAA